MRTAQRVIWILWPGFVMAIPAVGIAFTAIDPADLHAFGQPLALDRVGAYSLGFLLLWAVGACSSALTLLLSDKLEPESSSG